jgi:tetratricopeptide (TPR) repeat protein
MGCPYDARVTIHPEPGPHAPLRPRRLAALAFPLALVALGAIAVVALRMPARIVTGLPDDPGLAAVRQRVHGRLAVAPRELRFHSTLLGEGGAPDAALAEDAARALRAARAPWPPDPRRAAAVATLELAAGRPAEAERLYRQALELAPSYGEARVGLGVTLALRATGEGNSEQARGLMLRAISQFAAVAERDPAYVAALYDRAVLLAGVGRLDEARRHADTYLSLDPTSAWALALRRLLDGAPR